MQEIPGTQVVERIHKQIVEPVPQERDQRTVEQNARVSVPTVQEKTIVQEIPGTQVVELSQKQKQIAEAIPQERVQRTVEQNVCTSVPTPAQMPKSLDRLLGTSETEKEAYWNEHVDRMGPEQMHQERESSKKKKKETQSSSYGTDPGTQ